MQFTAPLRNMDDSTLYGGHVIVPADLADRLNEEVPDRRLIVTLNGAEEFHCALQPKGDDIWFIHVNKERQKKLKLKIGDEIRVAVRPDDSKYGMAVPEEFAELIRQDPEGDRCFHLLTMGKQRSLLHIINSAKRSDTRLRKAVAIIDYLKSTGGKLDFRELNKAMKQQR
jgi:hypothetical protein